MSCGGGEGVACHDRDELSREKNGWERSQDQENGRERGAESKVKKGAGDTYDYWGPWSEVRRVWFIQERDRDRDRLGKKINGVRRRLRKSWNVSNWFGSITANGDRKRVYRELANRKDKKLGRPLEIWEGGSQDFFSKPFALPCLSSIVKEIGKLVQNAMEESKGGVDEAKLDD